MGAAVPEISIHIASSLHLSKTKLPRPPTIRIDGQTQNKMQKKKSEKSKSI
jgi:hypothetical protein